MATGPWNQNLSWWFSYKFRHIQDSLVLQEKLPSHQMLNKLGWTSYEAICITYHVLCLVRQPTRKFILKSEKSRQKNKEGKIIQNCHFLLTIHCQLNRYKYLYLVSSVFVAPGPKFPATTDPSTLCSDLFQVLRTKFGLLWRLWTGWEGQTLWSSHIYCADERGTNCKTQIQIQIQTLWSSLKLRRAKIQNTKKCES